MNRIKITSIQSEVADYSCAAITDYLSSRLTVPVEFVNDIPWQERERLFDHGEIQVCWMCSLPYIWKVDQPSSHVDLLVAPVMQFSRYQNRPIYFSDVIVHRDSEFQTFADLRGASWAYNEPHSHSGYNITRYQLASIGEASGYFGQVIGSGAHVRSLQLVIDRQIDASAIDSTVLDLVLAEKPEIGGQIQIIDTWGPSPIPPWVVSKTLDLDLRRSLRELMLNMHKNAQGREILNRGQMDHFTQVVDQDYDPVRKMFHKASAVRLSPHDDK